MSTASTSSDAVSWTVEAAIPESVRAQIEFLRTSPTLRTAPKIGSLFTFLHIVRLLKKTPRTGWLNHSIAPAECESVADHMYRMGIISMLSSDQGLDSGRCAKIALVHDMAEAIVGDITPFDGVSKPEKHRRELETMRYLTHVLAEHSQEAADEIMQLWNEYETVGSKEARFVKDVDKFELMMQTLEYERDYNGEKDLHQFLGVREQIKSKEVGEWADAAIAVRQEAWASLQK